MKSKAGSSRRQIKFINPKPDLSEKRTQYKLQIWTVRGQILPQI